MAFSYGFFNAKNLDRVYTAEHFTSYLSSMICDGIQDTYGECFSITPAGGFQLRIGSGKAWIQGHYFQNDNGYILDLSQYADSSLPRYVTVGISCDTQESVRSVQIEVLAGTPAVAPFIPSFSNNDTKTTLTLCQVRVNGGSSGITASNITDCRDNEELCGYCRCILGKCRVTEMLTKMEQTNAYLEQLQKRLDDMSSQVADLQTKVDDLTGGDVLETGLCGENVYYVLYANGKLLLRGTGATYDYTAGNSVFAGNSNIKNIVVSKGVTNIGNKLFYHCANAETVSLPATLTSVGNAAFAQDDAVSNYTAGLTSVTIPQTVAEIQSYAFYCTAITGIVVPANVKTFGKYVFSGCANLQNARLECENIGSFAFSECVSLSDLTISVNCKTFGSNMLTYCKELTAITYEGTKEQWNAITKPTNWMTSDAKVKYHNGYLQRINCIDGAFIWNSKNMDWEEET